MDIERRTRKFYAETYDSVVTDWPNEIEFYRELARGVMAKGQALLEIACGTGRVAIRLAKEGIDTVGLDLSELMLDVARGKSREIANIHWSVGDMRRFDIGQTFGLAIIPGHAFQNILTPEDHVSTLTSISRHLVSEGMLVVHLDHPGESWLSGLKESLSSDFEPAGRFAHPITGEQICSYQAWAYEPATQTALSKQRWEAVDSHGKVVESWETGLLRFHVFSRFEMYHLLEGTGFLIEALYGNFMRDAFQNDSPEMIWIARKR